MRTILVVEDTPSLRTLVQLTLDDPAYRVLGVEDGLAAWELVQEERVDLFVLDWAMPRLDGVTLTRRLRAREETRTTPILMLTSHAGPDARREALEAGVDAFLTKPYSPLELLDRVEALFGDAAASSP